ncbi:MAG: hemolysin family protein [Halobacteriales archaeon]|nr:hemolysin family protein [Halobacteriales archaeon]
MVADLLLPLGRLFVALVLVLLNGFFVAAEFAFVRIRSTSVERLVEEGRPGSESLAVAVDSLDDYLAVTQLGITVSSLGLGWAGEPAVAALIEPVASSFLPQSAVHLVAFALGFGFITFLHVVFGELVPKTLSIQRAEQVSLLVAPPMRFFYYLFVPGIVVFNGTANRVAALLGVEPASETDDELDEREVLRVLSRSGEAGLIDDEEVRMIERVFDLDDKTVRSVMVPRPDVATMRAGLTPEGMREKVLEAGHTRYPVIEDGNVVGFVDAKDVLRHRDSEDVTACDAAHEPLVLPETTRLDRALARFQEDGTQIAVVIDEWGSFEGVVTVEDVVEELVGSIYDRFDEPGEEPSVEREGDAYVVDGTATVADLNEHLGDEIDAEGIRTVGGLVLDALARGAEVGDSVEIDGYVFEVRRTDGERVETVEVREPDVAEEETHAESEEDA